MKISLKTNNRVQIKQCLCQPKIPSRKIHFQSQKVSDAGK